MLQGMEGKEEEDMEDREWEREGYREWERKWDTEWDWEHGGIFEYSLQYAFDAR